jgi:hypothetical protein
MPCMVAHRDDEGKAVFFDVGRVELRVNVARSSSVSASSPALACSPVLSGRQPAGAGQLAGEIRMRAQHAEPLFGLAERNARQSTLCTPAAQS